MARGGAGAFGGKTINTAWVWLALLRRSSCSVWPTCAGRSRSATSTCSRCSRSRSRSASSTRARSSGARRSPTRRSSICSARCLWIARRDRPPRASTPVWPVWVLAAAAVFLAGFRVGLNVEAPRSTIDVGFAGVIGGQRIVNGQMPYGHMPGAGRPEGVRAGRRERRDPRADPDERALRGVERAGRHLRPRLVPRVRARVLVFGWTGKWDELWAAHATSLALRRALPDRARARRPSVRRQPAGRDARVRLGRVPVHALRLELEHERRDHARVPDLRLLARVLPVGARRAPSRSRAGRSSPRSCSRRSGSPTRRARWPLRLGRGGWSGRRASRSRRSRRSRSSCSSRIRSTRPASSASGRSASSSIGTRRSRSGAGASTTRRASRTCTSCSRCSRCCVVARRGRARVRAAAALAAPARRADRRAS